MRKEHRISMKNISHSIILSTDRCDELARCLTLRGYLVHEITGDPARLAAAKAFILDGLNDGSLKPIIARTFPFEEIAEAQRYLEANEQFGKVVVTL